MNQEESLHDDLPETLQIYFNECRKAIMEAGALVISSISNRNKCISEKSSATDLVTETDQAVETLLVEFLSKKFSNHDFIGEEEESCRNSSLKQRKLRNNPTWIIDPIDGTMNFIHSNPLNAISIGLVINKKIVMGLIYIPVSNELYSAIKGQGAFCNGQPIHVSDVSSLNKAMAIYELNTQNSEQQSHVENISRLLSSVQALRCYGSACVNLAFIASGSADFYVQCGIYSWDITAGAIIVKEAGGTVLDASGNEFNALSRQILVASSRSLASEVINLHLNSLQMEAELSGETIRL